MLDKKIELGYYDLHNYGNDINILTVCFLLTTGPGFAHITIMINYQIWQRMSEGGWWVVWCLSACWNLQLACMIFHNNAHGHVPAWPTPDYMVWQELQTSTLSSHVPECLRTQDVIRSCLVWWHTILSVIHTPYNHGFTNYSISNDVPEMDNGDLEKNIPELVYVNMILPSDTISTMVVKGASIS